jgi:hypothetical protein
MISFGDVPYKNCIIKVLYPSSKVNSLIGVGSISKAVMDEVPSGPISDFENTLSFPSEETSLGSGLPSHLLLEDVPCPSSPSHGFLHHIIVPLNNAM